MMMSYTLLALGLFIVSTSAAAVGDNSNGAASKTDTPTLSSVLSGILATLDKPVTINELLEALNKAGDGITALLDGKTVDHDEVSKVMEGCSNEDDTKATISMEGFFSFENKELATALGQLKCLALQAGRPNADEKTAQAALAGIGETTATIEAILGSVVADMVSGTDGENNDRARRGLFHHHHHHHHHHHFWSRVSHAVKHVVVSKIVHHVVVAVVG